MAAQTILLRDVETILDRDGFGVGSARSNRIKRFLFIMKFQTHDAPGNLRDVGMRKDVERGDKFGMRNQERTLVGAVISGVFGPAGGREIIDRENENWLMRDRYSRG